MGYLKKFNRNRWVNRKNKFIMPEDIGCDISTDEDMTTIVTKEGLVAYGNSHTWEKMASIYKHEM